MSRFGDPRGALLRSETGAANTRKTSLAKGKPDDWLRDKSKVISGEAFNAKLT